MTQLNLPCRETDRLFAEPEAAFFRDLLEVEELTFGNHLMVSPTALFRRSGRKKEPRS